MSVSSSWDTSKYNIWLFIFMYSIQAVVCTFYLICFMEDVFSLDVFYRRCILNTNKTPSAVKYVSC